MEWRGETLGGVTYTLAYGLAAIVVAQAALGARVVARLIHTAGGRRISDQEIALSPSDGASDAPNGSVAVLLPVLNEFLRVGACLDGLIALGPEVSEILVVDGGSTDATQTLVASYQARDPRVRLLDASPVPADWNGKAWGLDVGARHANSTCAWLLTVDADVRPTAHVARALLATQAQTGDDALSVATQQEIVGVGEGIVHPSLLATMIYRFGSPGHTMRRVGDVQANGQCMLFRRAALEAVGGFAAVRESICEDITIARLLVARGYAVGFYEAGDLVSVRMYTGWRETWRNWTRSLPMRDCFWGWRGALGLLEVVFAQALPLPMFVALATGLAFWLRGNGASGVFGAPVGVALAAGLIVEGALLAVRLGTLVGAARAYRRRPWSYWLSPLCDVPASAQLCVSALRRRHVWRGRVLVRGG